MNEHFSNIVPEINTVYFFLKNRTVVVHEVELEDTKDVSIIRISKKNRHHNGQGKSTNNDLQNIHIKPKIE